MIPQAVCSHERWPRGWAISCDFDGTITRGDVVQAMLDRFADPHWRAIEAEWEAGRISARSCLERQTRLLRVERDELAAWVDERPVDADAAAFFAECRDLGLKVRVVSDGFDWVIHRVMARLGFAETPIFANRLTPMTDGRWTMAFPFSRDECPSGTCKCALVAPSRPRMHIGDGRSDACVSDGCDLVFARDWLLATRQARGAPSIAFRSFADIRAALLDIRPPWAGSVPARVHA